MIKQASNAIFKHFPNEWCILFLKKAFEWNNILIYNLIWVQLDIFNIVSKEKDSSEILINFYYFCLIIIVTYRYVLIIIKKIATLLDNIVTKITSW